MKPTYQFHDLDGIMEVLCQLQRDAVSEEDSHRAADWEEVISQIFLANSDNPMDHATVDIQKIEPAIPPEAIGWLIHSGHAIAQGNFLTSDTADAFQVPKDVITNEGRIKVDKLLLDSQQLTEQCLPCRGTGITFGRSGDGHICQSCKGSGRYGG